MELIVKKEFQENLCGMKLGQVLINTSERQPFNDAGI